MFCQSGSLNIGVILPYLYNGPSHKPQCLLSSTKIILYSRIHMSVRQNLISETYKKSLVNLKIVQFLYVCLTCWIEFNDGQPYFDHQIY